MRDAVRAGLKPDEFWNYTPAEINLIVQSFWFRRGEDFKVTVWDAWHTAAWQRAKKMPRFSEVTPKDKATTEEQMTALFRTMKKKDS